MSYFDPKEEVIDLKLTPHGEFLLSIGKLNPVFYAFFDDDIVYDNNWASVTTEKQNQTEPRIQEETPRMHTQVSFSDREKDFIEFSSRNGSRYALYERDKKRFFDATGDELERRALELFKPQEDVQVNMKKLSQPIGRFKTTKEGKAPGWNIAFLDTKLDSAVDYLLLSGSSLGFSNCVKIPQLECDLQDTIERNSAAYNIKHEKNEESYLKTLSDFKKLRDN